jgi:hypothetical protein
MIRRRLPLYAYVQLLSFVTSFGWYLYCIVPLYASYAIATWGYGKYQQIKQMAASMGMTPGTLSTCVAVSCFILTLVCFAGPQAAAPTDNAANSDKKAAKKQRQESRMRHMAQQQGVHVPAGSRTTAK